MAQKNYLCPLCNSEGNSFYKQQFYKCSWCKSVFRSKEYFACSKSEKTRYESHNNNINDLGYQDFVSPIVKSVLENHCKSEDWLDFWAGTGPVISHLLQKKWYIPHLYDPFFHNYPKLLNKKYDYIIACEVIEHFYRPQKEFQLLYNLLKPKGKLYIMTDMYDPERDFEDWYYKNDVTHVFFYSKEAFQWIKENYSWKNYSINKRCIILEK